MSVRNLIRRNIYPTPLDATESIASVIANAKIANKGLPFCPTYEGDLLFQLASKPNVHRCLEIGFATGSTALYMLEGVSGKVDGEVISIDFKQSDFDYLGRRLVKASRHACRHRLIEGNTNAVLPELYKEGLTFDLAFLDGWKVFAHLLLDVYFAVRMLTEKGFIVFDDARMHSTRKVISILKRYYGFIEVDYWQCETWKHRIWFGFSQGMKDWRRPYRAFIKPTGFDSLPAITTFDYWRSF